MANYNIQMFQKDTEGYNTLYPKTLQENVNGLDDKISELNTTISTNYTNSINAVNSALSIASDASNTAARAQKYAENAWHAAQLIKVNSTATSYSGLNGRIGISVALPVTVMFVSYIYEIEFILIAPKRENYTSNNSIVFSLGFSNSQSSTSNGTSVSFSYEDVKSNQESYIYIQKAWAGGGQMYSTWTSSPVKTIGGASQWMNAATRNYSYAYLSAGAYVSSCHGAYINYRIIGNV